MPVTLIVLLAVLAAVALLLALRVRLIITYRTELCIRLRVLFLRFTLYPRKKKIKPKKYSPRKQARAEKWAAEKAARRAAKRAAKKKKQQKKKGAASLAPPKKKTLPERIRLIRALCAALIRRTHKHLRLHMARLHVRIGTDDAAKTAVLYGAVSQAISHLLFALDKITRLRAVEPQVAVIADFGNEKTTADIKLVISIRVWGVLATALGVGLSYAKNKLFKGKKRPSKKK